MSWFSGFIASKLLKRKSVENETNLIRQPKLWSNSILALSVVWILLLLSPLIAPEIFISSDDIIGIIIFSSIMLLAFLFFYIYLIVWKVEIFDTYFKFRSIFTRKQISYNNIEIRNVKSGFRFYDNNKHLLSVSYLQDNYKKLRQSIYIYQKANKIKINKSISNVLKPISLLWISTSLLLLLTLLTPVFILMEEGLNTAFYISLSANIISILLVLYMSNWRIDFDEKYLTKRSIWRLSKKYKIEYITYLEHQFFGHPEDTIIYYKNKKIAMIMGNVNNLQELKSVIDNKTKK